MTSTNVPLSLSKPWQKAWPDLTQRAAVYNGLRALGCDAAAARAWMATPLGVAYDRPDDLLAVVAPWIGSELPTQDAIAWADTLVFEPQDAWRWQAAGFTPEQAVFVHEVLLFSATLSSTEAAMQEEARWVASGLLPQDVVLGVATGLSVTGTVERVLRRGLTSADEGLMRTYAGLRGIDVQSLSADYKRLL